MLQGFRTAPKAPSCFNGFELYLLTEPAARTYRLMSIICFSFPANQYELYVQMHNTSLASRSLQVTVGSTGPGALEYSLWSEAESVSIRSRYHRKRNQNISGVYIAISSLQFKLLLLVVERKRERERPSFLFTHTHTHTLFLQLNHVCSISRMNQNKRNSITIFE